MGIYQSATEAHRDFSSMLDRAVSDRPQFISRAKDHILVIGEGFLDLTLSNHYVHAQIKKEEDNTFAATLDEIEDLIATGPSEDAAIKALAEELLEYADEYYSEFGLYSRAPNRKGHLPFVMRALTLGTPDKVCEMMVTRQTGKS